MGAADADADGGDADEDGPIIGATDAVAVALGGAAAAGVEALCDVAVLSGVDLQATRSSAHFAPARLASTNPARSWNRCGP